MSYHTRVPGKIRKLQCECRCSKIVISSGSFISNGSSLNRTMGSAYTNSQAGFRVEGTNITGTKIVTFRHQYGCLLGNLVFGSFKNRFTQSGSQMAYLAHYVHRYILPTLNPKPPTHFPAIISEQKPEGTSMLCPTLSPRIITTACL